MDNAAFIQWLNESGQLVLPLPLLQKAQNMNLSPEDLGFLVVAMGRCQEGLTAEKLANDKWIQWSLSQGLALWQGEGEKRSITFLPLWRKLFEIWQDSVRHQDDYSVKQKGEFNYSRILKWLDQERGTLSVTLKEKQTIQEFNLKYGWNTEFTLVFLQLAFEKGHNLAQTYQPIARRVYESGANTIEALVSLMSNLDWIHYKVIEIKKCIGQYGGVTRPQRELYLKWQNYWKLSHELILRAAMETVRTNNPSFKYIDAVLQSWSEKGVKSLIEAEKALEEHDRKIKTPTRNTIEKKKTNRTDNRDWENI